MSSNEIDVETLAQIHADGTAHTRMGKPDLAPEMRRY
jgi:hypothetical protein